MSMICIFGNSHLAALAQASQGLARLKELGHEVVFWGVAGSNFQKIRYDAGFVKSPVPQQSLRISEGRFEDLDLRVPDAILFYGFNIGPSYAARGIATKLQRSKGITSGLREAMTGDLIRQWWAGEIARDLIDRITGTFPEKRYVFAAQPLVAQHENFLKETLDIAAYRDIQNRLIEHCRSWMNKRSITFLDQPSETVVDGIFTDPIYSKGSVRLVSKDTHDAKDHTHMNADYGEKLLADLADRLGPAAAK